VILHRCGKDFYFLIVCTWRNSNEIWETVFYKNGDSMTEFALFPRGGTHLPTFCVWELAPVMREKAAWERFLGTSRDVAAATEWLADRGGGEACYALTRSPGIFCRGPLPGRAGPALAAKEYFLEH
jgi:hypothetical protein